MEKNLMFIIRINQIMNQPECYSSPGDKKKPAHKTIQIDMTPMVDLGFLLISFFIFTTTLNTPVTMSLAFPAPGAPSLLRESRVLTLLLHDHDKVYAYEGSWQSAHAKGIIQNSSWQEQTGIGELVRNKQRKLLEQAGAMGKNEMTLLIKPSAQASYKNIIDALDEAVINGVKQYAILTPSVEELAFLKEDSQRLPR